MTTDSWPLPDIVSQRDWQAAQAEQLRKEKALVHARDQLAAERRRLPMMALAQDYVFEGHDGKVALSDLFEGRRQLLLYHFMFAPGVNGWPNAGCPGCSLFMDNLGRFTRTHLRARDIAFAMVSRGPWPNLEAYRVRMGWDGPWVSSAGTSFNEDLGLTGPQGENHGMSALLRTPEGIFRTHFTSSRGLEYVGTLWSLLDLLPYGRRETWEDSPPGWPQTPPYEWWRRHDEYP